MSVQDSFSRIRQPLQKRVVNSLARSIGVRENFHNLLARFLELLEQALSSGDPAWLDPVLEEWSTARTQSDLEEGERNVTAMLHQIITYSFEIARENLNEAEALELVSALMPIYLHAIERVTALDSQIRVTYFTNELEKVQTRLARLDRSKSNFISIAAHELKTPLTLIEGYAAMIADLLPGSFEQIHSLLQGVFNGIRRLREIVEDMIDVSQLDNGVMRMNYQPVWLNRMLGLQKAEFQSILSERKQTLEIIPFEGYDQLLFADPARLYQAVRNLISNAVKYTPDGGIIRIHGRSLPGFIELIVQDNGIGIAPENHELIFEKFGTLGDISLHSSGKTKFKGGGPGLGLAITKGIIEAHGGSLWVESEGYDEVKRPGSTFHILLPVRTQPPDPRLARLFVAQTEPSTNQDPHQHSPAQDTHNSWSNG